MALSENFGFDPELLAIHLLRALSTTARRADGRTNLDELAVAVGARRSDVRHVLSTLHRQGFVDVVRMRPTLAGFAIGRAASLRRVRSLRSTTAAAHVKAA